MPRSHPSLRSTVALWALLAATAHAPPAQAQSLQGSTRSLDLQNRVAREHDFTFLDTRSRVEYFAEQGWLVRVRPNGDFALHGVSYPYARPEVDLFVRRLALQYRKACGEQLVVTSLTRPKSRNAQIRNASDRSVHPTGMAIDLRYSGNRRCRSWLQDVLLELERARILEATLERRPTHYHVAIFPRQYAAYVERITDGIPDPVQEYTVRRGDSLWTIARSYGTSVSEIRSANGLDGSRIYPGQVLSVPLGS